MVRYSKTMKIFPPKNIQTVEDINYNLSIIQTPLHGRECGKRYNSIECHDSKSKNNGRKGGAKSSDMAVSNSFHRRYIKPSPIITLTLSTQGRAGREATNSGNKVESERYITQYCLGYFFLKISLLNVKTGEIEDHKLSCNKIVVGQLVKLDDHHKNFNSFAFEYNDLSIKEKGEYRLIFQLYKVENSAASYVAKDGIQATCPVIKKLNFITSAPFEIFSGRKYYSEERKEERKKLLLSGYVSNNSSKSSKKKNIEASGNADSTGKNKGIVSLLNEHFVLKILQNNVNFVDDFGKEVNNAVAAGGPKVIVRGNKSKDVRYQTSFKVKKEKVNTLKRKQVDGKTVTKKAKTHSSSIPMLSSKSKITKSRSENPDNFAIKPTHKHLASAPVVSTTNAINTKFEDASVNKYFQIMSRPYREGGPELSNPQAASVVGTSFNGDQIQSSYLQDNLGYNVHNGFFESNGFFGNQIGKSALIQELDTQGYENYGTSKTQAENSSLNPVYQFNYNVHSDFDVFNNFNDNAVNGNATEHSVVSAPSPKDSSTGSCSSFTRPYSVAMEYPKYRHQMANGNFNFNMSHGQHQGHHHYQQQQSVETLEAPEVTSHQQAFDQTHVGLPVDEHSLFSGNSFTDSVAANCGTEEAVLLGQLNTYNGDGLRYNNSQLSSKNAGAVNGINDAVTSNGFLYLGDDSKGPDMLYRGYF